MSDPATSTWTPRVLDVNAQQADRPLYAALHKATANAVEPVFRARFESLVAAGVEEDLMHQADTLCSFLLNDEHVSPNAEGEAAHPELRQHLHQFLHARLPYREAAAADEALVQQMAAEFAGAVWATLLSRLNRQRANDGLVDPRQLLPRNLLTGETPLLKQVGADARHFGLAPQELNLVMAKTLTTLLVPNIAHDLAFLRWPLGLSVNRQALGAHVSQAKAEYLQVTRLMQEVKKAVRLKANNPIDSPLLQSKTHPLHASLAARRQR